MLQLQIPTFQWTKQLVCINWKKSKGYNRLEAVGIYRAKRPLPKKFLMIHGRFHKKKNKNKIRGAFWKTECPSQWSFHFLKCPTDSGKKSMLCKELSDNTRKLGAGLLCSNASKQNRNWLSSPKWNMIRVIDHQLSITYIYMCMMLMSSYHKAPEMWVKLQVKISGDCILTRVIDNLKEMGRPRVLQIWDPL